MRHVDGRPVAMDPVESATSEASVAVPLHSIPLRAKVAVSAPPPSMRGAPPPVLINAADDFHRFSTQFRLWLKQERSLLLFDLPRERARELFIEFAGAWNVGAVSRDLYRDDLGATALAADTARTAHTWRFATQSDAELDHLRSVGKAVNLLTHVVTSGGSGIAAKSSTTQRVAPSAASSASKGLGPRTIGPQLNHG